MIGLGRFGTALATTLMQLGHEVCGVDSDRDLVDAIGRQLTAAVCADTTDEAALAQLGPTDYGLAVVAIGSDVEASVLTVAQLDEMREKSGVELMIWAKANSEQHRKILERVGADRVFVPEHDSGMRVAHLLGRRTLDYLEVGGGYSLMKVMPPRDFVGRTLGDIGVMRRFGVIVLLINRRGSVFEQPRNDSLIGPNDVLIVAGETAKVEAFAEVN